jgi:hypothetical protein
MQTARSLRMPNKGPGRSIVLLIALVILLLANGKQAHGQRTSYAHSYWLSPFAAWSFPTGRFSEVDPAKLKPGHESGFCFGGEAGYFLAEFLAVGAGFDHVAFDQDFSGFAEAPPLSEASSTVPVGQAWARIFLPGGYDWWRPYAVIGAGLGKVTSLVKYTEPQARQGVSSSGNPVSIDAIEEEIRVKSSVTLTGGIGVLVPLSSRLSIAFEPRYRSVSTEGSDLTVKFTDEEGETLESSQGIDNGQPFQLKDRSNTNWWEIRGGVVLTIH